MRSIVIGLLLISSSFSYAGDYHELSPDKRYLLEERLSVVLKEYNAAMLGGWSELVRSSTHSPLEREWLNKFNLLPGLTVESIFEKYEVPSLKTDLRDMADLKVTEFQSVMSNGLVISDILSLIADSEKRALALDKHLYVLTDDVVNGVNELTEVYVESMGFPYCTIALALNYKRTPQVKLSSEMSCD